MGKSANGRCSVKKVLFFATSPCSEQWLACSARKGYSHRRLLFSLIILPEIRTEGICFSKEFTCSCAINKFRTGTLSRILNYSAEHLKMPGNYSTGSYLLMIGKKSVIFSGSKQIPQRNTTLSQENM